MIKQVDSTAMMVKPIDSTVMINKTDFIAMINQSDFTTLSKAGHSISAPPVPFKYEILDRILDFVAKEVELEIEITDYKKITILWGLHVRKWENRDTIKITGTPRFCDSVINYTEQKENVSSSTTLGGAFNKERGSTMIFSINSKSNFRNTVIYYLKRCIIVFSCCITVMVLYSLLIKISIT